MGLKSNRKHFTYMQHFQPASPKVDPPTSAGTYSHQDLERPGWRCAVSSPAPHLLRAFLYSPGSLPPVDREAQSLPLLAGVEESYGPLVEGR